MERKNKLKRYFINPCKECIVDACCSVPCKELKKIITTRDDILLIIGLVIAIILSILFWYSIYIFTSALIIFFILIWLSIGIWIHIYHIIEGINKKWYHILIILSLPCLLLGLLIGILLIECINKKLRR